MRSENIITELEKDHKNYPNSINTTNGIKYQKSKFGTYNLEYSKGFFVREIYSSENKKWESFGWND